ncbi:hypothetical protein [Paenibacillus glycanilyticus]|uniref:Uncharacterized protein n=1 Tax=Paenibacillus glycanilyticus TaxID=126569 RepID=A0ABQ6G918_9BACL|nr:hypothetical protein [Paenibacillus glycanilyticus]GLX67408.1 hypothetical protein MU1_17530 [Paenibacillus glycanilyticus]
MIRHMLQRLLGSVTGKHYNKHGQYGKGHYGQGHYSHSSSDYKKGNHYPPQQPPYGHSHYKKKYGSYSS